MENRGFIIYCIPEPFKFIYLQDSSCISAVLSTYKRLIKNNKKFSFNFDIVFTDDIRKAKIFLTRECCLKTVELLSSLISEDFKVEFVNYDIVNDVKLANV